MRSFSFQKNYLSSLRAFIIVMHVGQDRFGFLPKCTPADAVKVNCPKLLSDKICATSGAFLLRSSCTRGSV